jgi:hypothetical protein
MALLEDSIVLATGLHSESCPKSKQPKQQQQHLISLTEIQPLNDLDESQPPAPGSPEVSYKLR